VVTAMPGGGGRSYLRPVGLLPAMRLQNDQTGGYAGTLPLCGDGPFDFAAIEIITRQGRDIKRRLSTLGELWASDAGLSLQGASDTLARLTSPRRRIAGLTMTGAQLMGVVNVTPDSFSDGGQFGSIAEAVAHGQRLAEDGAAILDIGGESTRPGSSAISTDEELARVLPVIEALAQRTEALISIDTRKAEVARRALAAGAHMLNDTTALTHDPGMMAVAAEAGVPIVLMHALGDPKSMQDDPRYDDAPTDIFDYLAAKIEACVAAGIVRDRIMVDPGIGFGKTIAHNLQLLGSLTLFHGLGCPVLVGASRKRFIGTLTNEPVASKRVAGSIGAALAAASQGIQIIRVHDVRETKAALDVFMTALRGTVNA